MKKTLTLFIISLTMSSLALGQARLTFKALPPNETEIPCENNLLQITIDMDTVILKGGDTLKIFQNGRLLEEKITYSKLANNIKTITFSRDLFAGKDTLILFLRYKRTLEQAEKSLKLNLKDCPPSPQKSAADPMALYWSAITDTLKTKHLKFQKYRVARQADTVYIFLNKDLRPIDGTALPECNQKGTYYQIYVLTDEADKFSKADFFAENNFDTDEFNIGGGGASELSTGKSEPKLRVFQSDLPLGPFQSGVDFHVVLYKDRNEKNVFETENTFTITGCDKPIHVSILGGFYFSSLNNPTNIVQDTIPGSGNTTTLFADNAKSQRALTVMALFYPMPRNRDYSHKSLTFMQKWGVVFGTKLSQDLFDDLLLGLNYEFAKGGGFTTGVHYGEHNVVRGYDEFNFGKTPYTNGRFSNDKVTRQWDFGWFFGVTIDFRVISSMRLAGKRENDLNNSDQ